MPSFLCFSVRFLDPAPAFHGQRDGGEPEWPPSPLRAFQALVDAAANRWREIHYQEYAKPALSWLECQYAPMVIAPACHTGIPFRIAVPNNDLDLVASAWSKGQEAKKQPSELKTMKSVRTIHLRGGDAVHYLFPLPEDGCPHLDVLAAAARSITHVGWGVDMVAANAAILSDEEVAELPGERWRPSEQPSTNGLRVPIEGTLHDLARKHTAFLNRLSGDGFRPVPPLSAYKVVSYRRATDAVSRPYAAFELWQPLEKLATLPAGKSKFRPFVTTRWAATVAGMVRHAVDVAARQAGKPPGWINTFVHGHTPDGSDRATGDDADQRFAYLPLPSIEWRGSRGEYVGMIRRVLLVGPPGGDAQIAWARQALSGQELYAYGENDPIAMLSLIPNADRNVLPYTGQAAIWSTVTPVMLPGYDDADPTKAERLLRKTFEQSGLSPELAQKAELEWRSVGFRPGVDLASRYQLPESSVQRPTYHVRMRFRTPINGPLAIGAGRYRGLGLFAAERS